MIPRLAYAPPEKRGQICATLLTQRPHVHRSRQTRTSLCDILSSRLCLGLETLSLAQFASSFIRSHRVKCVTVDLACPEIVEGPNLRLSKGLP